MVKAGAMESQGLIIKQVQPLAVAISKDESVSWKHPITGDIQEIGFDDAGYRASIPNMGLPPIESIPKMDCVRMLYAKGTWYSLDNLPKLEQVPTIAPPPSSSSDGGSYWIDPGNGKWTAITSEGEGTGDSISAASDDLENRLNLEKSWGIDATEIDVETRSIIDRPEGLDDFPLVATVWDYLNTKDPRSLKQISDSMRAKGKIPEDVLRTKVGGFETYKDAIKTVVTFGVSKGYLRQVSEDTYEAIQEH